MSYVICNEIRTAEFCTLNHEHPKHITACGSSVCLSLSPRVHFGMNGSMRITSGAPGIKPVAADSKTPVLELHLTDDIIRFYESTSEIR